MELRRSMIDRFINESGTFRDDVIHRQLDLFRIKLVTREFPPTGAQIDVIGRGGDGYRYFCKRDQAGLPIRMREAVFSRLFSRLGIATPEFAAVSYDEDEANSLFGSREHRSTSTNMVRKKFLRTERRDELGRPLEYPTGMFSGVYAADLFVGNPDRSADNFVLHVESERTFRLCPIDFSMANLGVIGHSNKFPVERSETVQVGRDLRKVHMFCESSAFQMVDEIASVTKDEFAGFFRDLPPEWIDPVEREVLHEFWGSQKMFDKLQKLKAGLKNGQLL